ncbi:hypothetical protein T492DRAFT_834349 [Pavlovales sp. CCMP2436]|nr:hypothetical protein T492DRAFT_834349 [Pavlovales sp. CCMP2436]
MGADHAVSVVSGSETGPSSTGPGRRPAAPRARLPGTAELFASLVQSQRQVTGTDGMEAGDYTLRVTVIEAYGLAAKDKSGTSDPYVVASVGTERQRTHVVRRALSCTWGTTMAFELPNMTAGRAELLSIRFKVRDADTLTSELIGTCELEIAHVWQKPNHAVWHTWMALFSGEEVESTRGVASGRITRGYLRVSAAMLGPGRQMVMPLEPPRTNELRGVLISPNIRMTFGALFLDVLSVIGLKPLVPSSTQLRVSVQLRFAGIEVRTQANRVDVTDAVLTEVSFEQRLRLPLSLPSIADRIELTIVDDSSKAILASTTISLVLTERKARGEFKSVQLYGAAIGSKQAVADGMAHGEVQPTAWRATARCRIYRKLNGEADVRRALGGALGAVEGLRNTRIVEAEKGAFALLVRVFSATGVPASGVFSISVQLAHVEMDTRLVPSAGARAVEWNQPLALAAELPIERASQPDVFVSLRGPLRQLLAIARVPVAELGQMRPDEAELGYVRPRPRWLTLARVDASGALLPAVAGVGAETVELLLETHFGRENPRAGPFEAFDRDYTSTGPARASACPDGGQAQAAALRGGGAAR